MQTGVLLLHWPFKCQYFTLYSWIHFDHLHAGFMTTTRQRHSHNAHFIIKPCVANILNSTIRNVFNISSNNVFAFLTENKVQATLSWLKFWMQLFTQCIVLFSNSLTQDVIKVYGRSYSGVKHHIFTNNVKQNDQKHSVDKSNTTERNHSSSKRFTDVYLAVMTQNMANTTKLWTPENVNIYLNTRSSRSWVIERCLEMISTNVIS